MEKYKNWIIVIWIICIGIGMRIFNTYEPYTGLAFIGLSTLITYKLTINNKQ